MPAHATRHRHCRRRRLYVRDPTYRIRITVYASHRCVYIYTHLYVCIYVYVYVIARLQPTTLLIDDGIGL